MSTDTIPISFERLKELVATGLGNEQYAAVIDLVMDYCASSNKFLDSIFTYEDGKVFVDSRDFEGVKKGNQTWTLTLPLKQGELKIRVGKKGRDLLFGMMLADCVDNGEPEPLSFEQRARPLLELAKQHYQFHPDKRDYIEQIASIDALLRS